jgi:hypothetical protein
MSSLALYRIIWKNSVYMITLSILTLLYFVVTGIQFWCSDYFKIELGESANTVFITFSIVSITGPTIGIVLGGFVLNKLGGYENPRALWFCLGCSILGSVSAIFMPYVENFYFAAVQVWLLLFFGAGMVPGLMGIYYFICWFFYFKCDYNL